MLGNYEMQMRIRDTLAGTLWQPQTDGILIPVWKYHRVDKYYHRLIGLQNQEQEKTPRQVHCQVKAESRRLIEFVSGVDISCLDSPSTIIITGGLPPIL